MKDLRKLLFTAINICVCCAIAVSCSESKSKDTSKLMAEKGGWRVILQLDKSLIDDSAINVLKSRLEGFGIESPGIYPVKGKEDQLLVEMPGVNHTNWIEVSDVLQSRANLEFFLTYKNDFAKIAGQDIITIDNESGNEISNQIKYLQYGGNITDAQTGEINVYQMTNPIVGYFEVRDTAKIGNLLRSPDYSHTPGMQYRWGHTPEVKGYAEYYPLYALRSANGKPRLTGTCITDAEAFYNENTGSWGINLSMDRTGSRQWEEITGENIGWPIAIVLDDEVLSAPHVTGKITGGYSQITGDFTEEEALIIASLIKTGKLDYRVDIYSSEFVSPEK